MTWKSKKEKLFIYKLWNVTNSNWNQKGFFNEIIILSHIMYFDRDQSDFNWIRLN